MGGTISTMLLAVRTRKLKRCLAISQEVHERERAKRKRRRLEFQLSEKHRIGFEIGNFREKVLQQDGGNDFTGFFTNSVQAHGLSWRLRIQPAAACEEDIAVFLTCDDASSQKNPVHAFVTYVIDPFLVSRMQEVTYVSPQGIQNYGSRWHQNVVRQNCIQNNGSFVVFVNLIRLYTH